MIYLKEYNRFYESSSDEEIVSYLKDIFLEIEHDGFNVSIDMSTSLYNFGRVYSILIYKSNIPLQNSPNESDRFKMKDILETLLTTESYMESLGYRISLIQTSEPNNRRSQSDLTGYDSSVLKSGRKEQSRETFTLKIEFAKK